MIPASIKFTVFAALALSLSGSNSLGSDKDWQLSHVRFSQSIKVEKGEPGRDVVYLSPTEKIEVRGELSAEEAKAAGLTASESAEVGSLKREVLQTALRASLSENFSGSMVGSQTEGYSFSPAESISSRSLIPVNPVLTALESSGKTGADGKPGKVDRKKFLARVKEFAKFMNDAVVLSTYREFISYKKKMKEVGPKVDEFGVSLNLKIEMQLGVGSFNFSRNGALVLDLGYNKVSHKFALRTGLRKEMLNDGMGFPAVKFEVRAYEMIAGGPVANPAAKGHAWYPPAIPMVSLVLDSSDHYLAQGIVFSFNVGDLIPGACFMNTVNSFEEKETRTDFIDIPKNVFLSLTALAHKMMGNRGYACQAVFR